MDEIDNILLRYRFGKRNSAIDIDFKKIEQETGYELPGDYKYFLQNYSESEDYIGAEHFNLFEHRDLFVWKKDDINSHPNNVIAIGNDMTGAFIGMEYINGSYRIILGQLVGESEFIEIGNSFTDFLARLNVGGEA